MMMAKKVMIVDDQAGTTKVVGLIASQIGLDCKVLNNSMHATEAFIDYQPDVLILDMIMPEKDGIDVLNEVLLTNIPTKIVLTSAAGHAYLRLAKGVADFHDCNQVTILKKPFRRDDVVAVLTRLTAEDAAAPATEAA